MQLLGDITIGDKQVNNIMDLLRAGNLYAGSDGSVKDGCGSHAYGFTNGTGAGTVWGGSAITPGSAVEMSSLQAEHEGEAFGCYWGYMPFIYIWTRRI